MALHAQRQRLDAGQDQERVERRKRRADVAQPEHAAGDREGEIAERLVQHDAVIFRARIGQHRIAALARPVELAAVHDHAADRLPWPPRNLVSECTTMSAPCSKGLHR